MLATPPVSKKKPSASGSSKLPAVLSNKLIVSKVTAGLLFASAPKNVFVYVPAKVGSSLTVPTDSKFSNLDTLELIIAGSALSLPNLSTALIYR